VSSQEASTPPSRAGEGKEVVLVQAEGLRRVERDALAVASGGELVGQEERLVERGEAGLAEGVLGLLEGEEDFDEVTSVETFSTPHSHQCQHRRQGEESA
jgi:hypothetical protein